jgi:addiction module HigA family antidote
MIPTHRIPEHPGEVLLEEFLRPLKMSQSALAAHLGVPVQRINELVNGRRGITPETAWMLGKAFRVGPEFWMNLQTTFDLAVSRRKAEGVRPVKKAG